MAKVLPTGKMDVDTFLAWALTQSGGRYELAGGYVVAMAPERAVHGRAKFEIAVVFREAIRAAGLPCETFVDSIGVRTDENTFYEPDVFVRCGERTDGQAMEVNDPLIIVGVISPSSKSIDTGRKFMDYFRVPSLRHYLVIDTELRRAVHHERDEAGNVSTRIVAEGAVQLDPPGIAFNLGEALAGID